MTLTYIAVRRQEDSIRSYSFRAESNHLRRQSRQVFRKGVLFVGAFCCVWVPLLLRSLIVRYSGSRTGILSNIGTLCVAIFLPLQGFLNLIIYNYQNITSTIFCSLVGRVTSALSISSSRRRSDEVQLSDVDVVNDSTTDEV